MSDSTPKPMTGPEHVREALRLAAYADQQDWPLPTGGLDQPTEERRTRVMMRATLAQTAAMVDTIRWGDGTVARDGDDQRAWHQVFSVRSPRL